MNGATLKGPSIKDVCRKREGVRPNADKTGQGEGFYMDPQCTLSPDFKNWHDCTSKLFSC